jgi:TonB family protein
VGVFNFNEVDEVTETTDDPRRPIPRIEAPGRQTPVLGSTLIHAAILALLLLIQPREPKPVEVAKPAERRAFFLPKELSKPPAPKVAVAATPVPTPPPQTPIATPPPPPPKTAKISIGEASEQRLKELMLERDRDIGRRGAKVAQEQQAPQEQATPESERRAGEGRGADAERTGLPLPTGGSMSMPRADDSRAQGPSGGLLSASTRSVERALREKRDTAPLEIAGHQMGPLFFDPEGADFTRWINHFKSEVYRNWIIPEPARMGIRGQVAIEFVVERSGRLARLTMLSPSGTPALDRAASNALQGSDLMALPEDYPEQSVTMRVTFVY